MGSRLGMGTVVAALGALLLAAAVAEATTFVGGTDQPGKDEVRLHGDDRGPIRTGSFDWIGYCHKGGSIRSTTVIEDFNRASPAGFADSFNGRVKDGRHTLKLRYTFAGKRVRRARYVGTLRLSARYTGGRKPVKGACRTRLVRWAARLVPEDEG